jgi:predicted amidohydrolase
MRAAWLVVAMAAIALGLGCSDDSTPADSGVDLPITTDGGTEGGPPESGITDQYTGDILAHNPVRVAAVQIDIDAVAGGLTECENQEPTCALVTLVKQAVGQGALMVVTPDYGAYPGGTGSNASIELEPAVGDTPATDARWLTGSMLRTMAALAAEEQIWLTFTVFTYRAGNTSEWRHTTVAVDPQGVVQAVHNKYMLFGTEVAEFVAGDSLATSFFQSPLGKTGLMSTAEAQCFVKDGNVSGTCTAHASTMYTDYLAEAPDAALFSAWWFGGAEFQWQALNVMSTVASRLGAWLVVGNGTQAPNGNGGGVWRPDGSQHKVEQPTESKVIVTDVPAKGTWTPPDAGPDAAPDAGTPDTASSDSGTPDGPLVDALVQE